MVMKKEKFEKFGSVSNKTGQWINNWTRVLRVFKTTIILCFVNVFI